MAEKAKAPRKRKKKSGVNNPQVSFTIDRDLKELVGAAAVDHGRTQGAQFAQCVKDGVGLQPLIKEVSEHLTVTEMYDGFPVKYIPNEDTCMNYIQDRVRLCIAREKEGLGDAAEVAASGE